ncbi:unnamed protein product [Closterium sp. NIES-65]|nr:unnamed protein product [Closterium sp. NIES-65]
MHSHSSLPRLSPFPQRPLPTTHCRPRKEVWPLTARLLQEMSEARTVVVGVHVRMSDSVFGASKGGVTDASMAAALENAAPILACAKAVEDMWYPAPLTVRWMFITDSHRHLNTTTLAPFFSPPPLLSPCQAVEDMWYPPPLTVRWMFITNSIDLKMAIRSRFPGKLLETDFVPHHSQSFSDEDKEQAKEEAEQGYREMVAEWLLLSSSNSFLLETDFVPHHSQSFSDEDKEQAKEAAEQGHREMVAEWLLLSSSNAFVLPVSGFSRTAAMYSLNARALFTPPYYCDPEQPHLQTDFGMAYSGI